MDDEFPVVAGRSNRPTIELNRGRGHWANYPLGVAWALERTEIRLKGANIYIAGEIPVGAGLSSSAAIEVAVAFALLRESGHELGLAELAQLCQRAENEFVGARV